MHGHHRSFLGAAAPVALGFIAGLAIPHVKKAAMQGPTLAAGGWVEGLKAEHRLVEGLFAKLFETDSGDAAKRDLLLTKIAYALTKHGVQEENVIYPAIAEMREVEEAKHLVDDHADIKTFIYELRRMSSVDVRWIVRVREFQDVVDRHVREEEDEIFPALQAALSDAENSKLTQMMNWEGFKVA